MKGEIINSLNLRYSVKIFDKNLTISEKDWSIIEDALILTPSSFGLEPWKFLVITNKELKKELKAYSFNQAQIEDCSHLLVLCAKKYIDNEYIKKCMQNIAKVRNVDISTLNQYKDVISSYMMQEKDHLNYATNQTFIALGNILTVAAMLKIDACPIGGFISREYDKILKIPDGFTSSVVCAFGYRSEEDKYARLAKVRQSKKELIIKYN
jgi:nitroreductase